jgi:ribonuclease T2
MRWCLALILALSGTGGGSDTPGAFDYYVLSLSWSPNWCVLEGDARGSEQCDPRRDHGWILHGLWPQHETGYPTDCQSPHAPPTRRMTAGMADIMGTSGLAWHQWRKHGTCTGLSAEAYFALSREAYSAIERPDVLRRLAEPVRIAPRVIEDAFISANPDLQPDGVTITCRGDHIQEARICLTRDLSPRPCGRDVQRDCTRTSILTPIR